MVVVWSRRAKTELQKAFDYIKQDSFQNAEKVVVEIIDATISLPLHPLKYNPDKYKKNNNGDWRSFELHKYRITYRITQDQIRIVRLRHTSRTPLDY